MTEILSSKTEANHSWQDICQGTSELEHDDHDGDGDSHNATARLSP
jgi:hypothetical protein